MSDFMYLLPQGLRGKLPYGIKENDLETFVTGIIRTGKIILALQGNTEERHKGDSNGADLVTDADHRCENLIIQSIRRLWPDHGIVAEESAQTSDGRTVFEWIIDPIDGTCNFVRGTRGWNILVGMVFNNNPVMGIVYNPVDDDLYIAVDNVGAWKNGVQLPAAKPAPAPREWMVCVGWPHNQWQRFRTALFAWRLGKRTRGLYTLAATGANMTLMAEGKIDVFFNGQSAPWDYCAGAVLLKALGYELRTWDGDEWKLGDPTLIACRPGTWPLARSACWPFTPRE